MAQCKAHQMNTRIVVNRMMLIVTTSTSHILSNQFSSKCKEWQSCHKNIAIYSKLHVTVMAMGMLQQVGFLPGYLTSLSMYVVLFLREVKSKNVDDLEIVKIAD